MIARLWHGWTTRGNADAFEQLLTTRVLPGIHRVEGYRGSFLLRNDAEDEVEFVTLTLFDSMDAVREFAGENYKVAVIDPEGGTLLSRFDPTSAHYEVISSPQGSVGSRQ